MEEIKEDHFSFEKNLSENHKKESELKRRLEAIRVQTYNRIKDNPEVKEFLKPYNSFFYESFLQSFAAGKSLWVGLKDHYKERQVQNELRLMDTGRNALACLLKKKMRDIRREWGAGSFDLPGIQTPFNFMLLVDKVFEVEWIPAIDESDLECLLAYVAQHQGYDLSFQFDNESLRFEIPLWLDSSTVYESKDSFASFHNAFTSTENLKVLPDKRGRKAQDYVKAYAQKLLDEKEAKIARGELPPDTEIDLRPFPPSGKSWFIEEFILKFDERETIQHYRNYKAYHKKGDDEDEDTISDKVQTILVQLEHLDVVLPVTANEDWRLALIESWEAYRKVSVSRAIQQAYEDYLFHVDTGIAFQSDEIKPETLKKVNDLKERFLNGRELLGEPRDFSI